MLLCKCDQLHIKLVRRADADRIQRIGNDHIFCPFQRFFRYALQIRKVAILFLYTVVLHIRLCHDPAHLKHRIARIRNKDHITRVAEYHADMCHGLLRAVDRHHFICTDMYSESFFITITDRLKKFRQIRQRIFIILRIPAGVLHRLHHMRRRPEIRCPDRQIIDFSSFPKKFFLFFIQGSEDPRLKIIDQGRKMTAVHFNVLLFMYSAIWP